MSAAGKGIRREEANIDEVIAAAERLFYAMRKARTTSGRAVGGLSAAQVTMIEPLLNEPELSVGRLAEAAGVAVPTATRMLKQLEAKDVVSRRRSPDDDRQVLISLTGHGRAELSAVRTALRQRQVQRLRTLTPAERRGLVHHLDLLTELVADRQS